MHNLSTLIINSRCFFTRIIPVLCLLNATNPAYADDAAFILRINAGGDNYTDSKGHFWQADKGFNTGRLSGSAAGATYSDTDDQVLYQSGRWDAPVAPELRYRFAVPDGFYTVSLHFANSWSGIQGDGLQVFDVMLENERVLDNLDIFAEAGGNAALVKALTTQVSDGALDIDFVHQVENPQIRAIEIKQNLVLSGELDITLEGEDYTAVSDTNNDGVDDFTQNSRVDASNGAYMQAKGQRENSYLEYQVNLPVDDVYEIALRGTGTSNGSNSFFVSVDEGVDSAVHLNVDDSWSWKTVVDPNSGLGPYSLSKGNHTIRIVQREFNAKIDQLKITNTAGESLPVTSFSPDSLSFGSRDVGSVSNPQNITLTNSGSASLNLLGITTTGDFSESNDCGDVLAQGASCQIEIRFSPAIAGNITGTLTVISDDANSPVQVSLSGSGKAIVSDSVFFNMDLSSYADGTRWTPEIQNKIFGTTVKTFKGSVLRFVENGQVMIVKDPYGSGKNVLRIELRPEDFGNIIVPHINIYKYGAPANMREGTSRLEVALSENWGHGPTGIHMPFWRSKRFQAQRKPILPDVYAFFHQYTGDNSSIDARWRDAGFSGGPFRKSSIDRMANFYTYDQGRFQRSAYSNFSDPTVTNVSDLPIAQPGQFKTDGYITQQAHIKLSTPGLKDGFYQGYQGGQLVFDRSNIMTLPAGQTEDLKLFAFVFYVNGGPVNGVHWSVPNDGKGPKYMYIRTFTLQAGGPGE